MVEDVHDDIVRRMQGGDAEAFARILDRHLGQITSYIQRFLPGASAADAEDLAQETFIRLWTARQSFDTGRVKLSTWLHRIAHNLCIDHLRKQHHDGEARETEAAGTPEQLVTEQDRRRQLNVALMQLEERQRSALVLCHYQGFSASEAATIMDVSIDAYESLLRRSRKKLKDLLLPS